VVADIVDIARELAADQLPQIPALGVDADSITEIDSVPMAQVVTPWYLRLNVQDKPGVMSKVSSILSERGISIEALIQKPPTKGQQSVSLVVLTNPAEQAQLLGAVAEIEALETTLSDVMRIRVETLKG
jgi:homoserine dehydrogenase